jgi:hypothetical protein
MAFPTNKTVTVGTFYIELYLKTSYVSKKWATVLIIKNGILIINSTAPPTHQAGNDNRN